ncbi:hypothetical protein ACTWQF_19720 [Streptomyces sp. 8N114]|uniref:hypothetical protein n=1 Tax=Streptomyces sp. 8N114 TaxID=3457419 RepID=UPI003FD67A21
MQQIEFLNYPSSAPASQGPEESVYGFRIDGTDLRVSVAEATRALWAQEGHEQTPAEQEEFLLTQHDGLSLSEIGDPVRHFLGDPAPEFADSASGSTVVLGCSCGIWGCWPLMARITTTAGTVTWSAFRQPFRKQWGEFAIGPYVFDRAAYKTALTRPVQLTADPLAVPD